MTDSSPITSHPCWAYISMRSVGLEMPLKETSEWRYMKTDNPNSAIRISMTEDAVSIAEYMLPSWRVVLLIFAGMLLAMPLYLPNIVTWLIGGIPSMWLTVIALRRRTVTIDLRRKQVVVGRGLIVPFHRSRYDFSEFTGLRTDTSRVSKSQGYGQKSVQTVTKKFILDGKKSCLLCRRGYGGTDKEIQSRLWEVERQLKAMLEPHLRRDT
jgi:hypothetical protein